jgi:leucyl aminopeptidase
MKIEFVDLTEAAGGSTALAAPVFEDGKLSLAAEALDKRLSGQVKRAIASSRFKGAIGQSLDLVAPPGLEAGRLVLIGAGKQDAFEPKTAELLAAHAYQAVKASGAEILQLVLEGEPADVAARAAFGARLASYRFDKYRTTEKPEKKPSVSSLKIATDDPKAAKAAFKPLSELADAVFFTRNLVSEPANILYPQEFARRVRELGDKGLEIQVLGEEEMKGLGMGALLGVGQGSARESQLVVLEWKGAADPKAQPIAFVGKGVCFDTGGISIKSAEGMEEMITDMAGAAAVAGAMWALASRKAKVNAVGILGLVENMPSDRAQRPGDVVTSMSGQTVEVINTDAEGRLVLADALWYCQSRFKPKLMIDLATLTGAIIVSLGKDLAGLFSNNDELVERLMAASKASDEPLWRMPLPAQYEKNIESQVADMKNVGPRYGGSITAALFIQKFVAGLPWAHIDMASTAWKPSSSFPTIPNGATGFGVRLLDQLARAYED